MTPERWQKVKKVFDGALRCEPQRRVEYLTDAWAGDPEMLNEVHSLLSAHDAAGSFIEDFVLDSSAVAIPEVHIVDGWRGRRLADPDKPSTAVFAPPWETPLKGKDS